MSPRSIFLFLLVALFPVVLFSQDFNTYQPLKSSGQVPDDFVLGVQEKIEAGTDIVDNKKGWEKKMRLDFLVSNTYTMGQMLSSGRVLFGDPVTNYINKVKAILLKDNPELMDQIRIYTVKTNEVNAYATNDGVIFVTTGLMAQLESEAQLAYILSHEFIHYINKHNINSYIKNKQVLKGKREYNKLSFREKLLTSHSYSRELETESDIEGLEKFYDKSPYSYEAVNGVFDVLQFSFLPYDDKPFNYSIIGNNTSEIPEEYRKSKIKEISIDEDYDDSMHSHPNIKKRRSEANFIIEAKDNTGRVHFTMGEEEFNKIRLMCRFELVRTAVLDNDFPTALYLISLLKDEVPESYFLDKYLVASLYGVAKMKTHSITIASLSQTSEIQGQSLPVYTLIRKLNKKQITILALAKAWEQRMKFPDDVYFRKVSEDLLEMAVFKHKVNPTDFYSKPKTAMMEEYGITADAGTGIVKTIIEETVEENVFGETVTSEKEVEVSTQPEVEEEEENEEMFEGMTRAEKIRMKQEIKKLKSDDNFIDFAFVEILKDSEFRSKFREQANKRDEKERAEAEMSLADKKKAQRLAYKEIQRTKKKGYALNESSLMILEPVYVKNVKQETNYTLSNHNRIRLTQGMEQKAAEMGLKTTIFNLKDLDKNETAQFNEAVLMKEWARERLDFEDVSIISSQINEVEKVAQKYGTNKILIPGVIADRYKKDPAVTAVKVWLYTVSVVLAPLAIYEIVRLDYVTQYYYLVYNVDTGESVIPGYKRKNSMDSGSGSITFFNKVLKQVKRSEI